MNLILTMAGLYQRFASEGFKIPKYLLPWGDKTILAEILIELNKDDAFKNILLVANKKDEAYFPHVRAIMKSNGISNANLIEISNTSGQAQTAMIGIEALKSIADNENSPIAFHNIDTILLNRNFSHVPSLMQVNFGYIDIFKANNKAYSYVLTDHNARITSITEKIVVSNSATSGFYVFRNPALFKQYFHKDDLYISSLFARLINDDKNIIASDLHKEDDTIVLGTPMEYINASSTML